MSLRENLGLGNNFVVVKIFAIFIMTVASLGKMNDFATILLIQKRNIFITMTCTIAEDAGISYTHDFLSK